MAGRGFLDPIHINSPPDVCISFCERTQREHDVSGLRADERDRPRCVIVWRSIGLQGDIGLLKKQSRGGFAEFAGDLAAIMRLILLPEKNYIF
jgi:hypothetical protein